MTDQPILSSNQAQDVVTRHLLISGRVQGVSFRYFMREQAKLLGIQGWCRNLPNGRVEAWIQGLSVQIEAMTDWAHQGPDSAIVEHVELQDIQSPEGELGEFEIRR